MKKTICILLTLSCLLAMTACSKLGAFSEENTTSENTGENVSASPDASATTVTDLEITISFEFGDRSGTYTGEMRDGLPDGQGTFSTQNAEGVGWIYDGGWRQGHMYGEGSTMFDSGYSEAGWYEDDNLNGQGKLFQDERLTYEGGFVQNIPDGQGTIYSYSGDIIYSGNFDQGYIDETEDARTERMNGFRQQCDPVNYSELYTRAQNEDGSFIQITGTVVYLADSEDFAYECSFVISGQNFVGTDAVYVHYHLNKGEKRIMEGQQVTVWAQVSYLSTSESEDGASVSMPFIEAWNVVDVSGTVL